MNKTQERYCARSSGTNVLVLEQTRDKFTSLLIVKCTRTSSNNVVTEHLLNRNCVLELRHVTNVTLRLGFSLIVEPGSKFSEFG